MKRRIAVSVSIPVGAAILLLNLAGTPGPQPSAEPDPAQAAPVWQAVGPYGGWIGSLVKNPKNPRELFALVSSSPSQIFKSSNAGSSWKRIGLVRASLGDLAVHPSNPNVLYSISNTSVFKSSDQGRTFKELPQPYPKLARLDGNISIDPRKPDTIRISGSYRYGDNLNKRCLAVFVSKNGGLSWTVHKFEAEAKPDYTFDPRVAASPVRSGLVFFSGSYRSGSRLSIRVLKSVNGGTTWTDVTGSISQSPHDLLLHPKDPDRIFIATDRSVYRSSDGGKSWAKQLSPNSMPAGVLGMDSTDPRVLYSGGGIFALGAPVFIYKSVDGGVKWTRSKPDTGLAGDCARIVEGAGSVYFASSVGIFKSADGGNTWKPGHAGIAASTVPAFALAPTSPKTIYAEISSYACFKTVNAGGSWIKLGNFAGCGQVLKIISHPSIADTVYLLKGG